MASYASVAKSGPKQSAADAVPPPVPSIEHSTEDGSDHLTGSVNVVPAGFKDTLSTSDNMSAEEAIEILHGEEEEDEDREEAEAEKQSKKKKGKNLLKKVTRKDNLSKRDEYALGGGVGLLNAVLVAGIAWVGYKKFKAGDWSGWKAAGFGFGAVTLLASVEAGAATVWNKNT